MEEQLSAVAAEKDSVMSRHHEALEKIQVNITSLTEERDQLQERVEKLERDNSQLEEHHHGSSVEDVAELQQVCNLDLNISFMCECVC